MRMTILLVLAAGAGCSSRAIDVDPQAASLLGTWTNQSQVQVFDEHGSVTVSDTLYSSASLASIDPEGNPSGTFFTGTFSTTDGSLSALGYSGFFPRSEAQIGDDLDFQIVGDLLGERLLRPATPPDGFVGRWQASWTNTLVLTPAEGESSVEHIELSLVLAADQTARQTVTGAGNPTDDGTCTGTWASTDEGPSLSWADGCTTPANLVAPSDSPVYRQIAPGLLALDTLERAHSL